MTGYQRKKLLKLVRKSSGELDHVANEKLLTIAETLRDDLTKLIEEIYENERQTH